MTRDVQEAVEAALTKPDDFGYYGREEMFITWGITGPHRNRDSGPLDVSNFETIYADLKERFPDDIDQENFGHWAVGWVDSVVCRVLDDEGEPTEAFLAVLDWKERLESYPVADDDDYSEREHEEFVESIKFIADSEFTLKNERSYEQVEELGEDWADRIASWLYEHKSAARAEDCTMDDVNEAQVALGLAKEVIDEEQEAEAEKKWFSSLYTETEDDSGSF